MTAPIDIEPVTTTVFESMIKLHESGLGAARWPSETGIGSKLRRRRTLNRRPASLGQSAASC